MARLTIALLAGALLSLPASASFTRVQKATNGACTSTSTTCSVTVSSTGSGHAIIVMERSQAASITISSVSGGGTYTQCTTCAGSQTQAATSTDIFYTLASTSGTTSITVTRSASGSAWACEVAEYSVTAGNTIAYDASNNVNDSTGAISQPGVALTLGGTNDVITQAAGISSTQTINSVSSPYTVLDPSPAATYMFVESINTSSGSAPTFTLGASNRLEASALALKEVSGGTTCAHALLLLHAGCT